MPLPDEMLRTQVAPLRAEEVIAECEERSERADWDGIRDAFEPVRRLVEGDEALVEADIYAACRGVTARVLSACQRGSGREALGILLPHRRVFSGSALDSVPELQGRWGD